MNAHFAYTATSDWQTINTSLFLFVSDKRGKSDHWMEQLVGLGEIRNKYLNWGCTQRPVPSPPPPLPLHYILHDTPVEETHSKCAVQQKRLRHLRHRVAVFIDEMLCITEKNSSGQTDGYHYITLADVQKQVKKTFGSARRFRA